MTGAGRRDEAGVRTRDVKEEGHICLICLSELLNVGIDSGCP